MKTAGKVCLSISLFLVAACIIGIAVVWTRRTRDKEDQQPVAAPSQCEQLGGIASTDGLNCFVTVTNLRTWVDARADCVSRSGDLASIRSSVEQTAAVSSAFPGGSNRPYVWFGLNSRTTLAVYAFSDSATFSYTSWFPGQPVNDTLLRCGSLIGNTTTNDGSWVLRDCTAQYAYVCKIPLAFAPGAPTNAAATAGPRANQASVSFTAPSSNGGSPITTYLVTSYPDGVTATGTASPINITGLTIGRSYNFTVAALNLVGQGAQSGFSNNVVPFAELPSAPAIYNLSIGNAQVSVFFSSPAWFGGQGVTIDNYTVTSNPGNFVQTGATSPISVNGLMNDVNYTFTVTATNIRGSSPASAPSSPIAPRDLIPAAPVSIVATAGPQSVSVTFPASNFTGTVTRYTVVALPPGTMQTTATVAAVNFFPLSPSITYTFYVYASSADGDGSSSPLSTPVSPTAQTPSAPTNVTAVVQSSSEGGAVSVSFNIPADPLTCTCRGDGGSAITSFIVYVNSSSDSLNATCTLPRGASLSTYTCEIGGLTNGVDYTAAVVAVNSVGASAPSAFTASFRPALTAPNAPAIGTPVGGNGQATVTFSVPRSGGSPITNFTIGLNPPQPVASFVVAAATACTTPSTFGSQCSVVAQNLVADQPYTFTVFATNGIGESPVSQPSASVNITAIAPSAVTNLNATGGRQQIVVRFVPDYNGGAPIRYYSVTSNPGNLVKNVTVPEAVFLSTPIDPQGITTGTSYTFTVVAVNSKGSSPVTGPSNAASAAANLPDPPTNVTAAVLDNTITVAFIAPVNNGGIAIRNYTLFIHTASDGEVYSSTALGATTSVIVTTFPFDVSLYFTVRATNDIGTSLQSVPSAPVTVQSPPASTGEVSLGAKIAVAVILGVSIASALIGTVFCWVKRLYCFKKPTDNMAKLGSTEQLGSTTGLVQPAMSMASIPTSPSV